jgi:hypothetical protein
LTEGVKQNIIDLFNETDTLTYKDGAKKLGISKSTLHDYATKDMDYRCLSQIMRPMLRDPNIERRMEMSPDIVAAPAPLTDEFHRKEELPQPPSRHQGPRVYHDGQGILH